MEQQNTWLDEYEQLYSELNTLRAIVKEKEAQISRLVNNNIPAY